MPTQFVKDQSYFYISAFVIGIHAILIIWMSLTWEARPPPPKAAQRLVVQTVALIQSQPRPSPPVAVPIVEEIQAPEPIPEPILETIPEPTPAPLPAPATPPVTEVQEKPQPTKPKVKPKTPQPKKIEKKKSKPEPVVVKKAKPAPVAEKNKPIETKPKSPDPTQIKNRELLAKAQESIAKIKATSGTIGAGKITKQPELKIPQLKSLAKAGDEEIAGWSSGEVGYRDELASRLKLQLRLPEYGEVKVKLTLARAGRFVKVFIVSSESKANRQYIEKTISALTFPPFGHHFEDKDEYTFSITLSNEL